MGMASRSTARTARDPRIDLVLIPGNASRSDRDRPRELAGLHGGVNPTAAVADFILDLERRSRRLCGDEWGLLGTVLAFSEPPGR